MTSQFRSVALRVAIVVVLLGGAVGIAGLLGSMKPPPERREVENPEPLIEVTAVHAEQVTFSVSSQGSVRPRNETVLSAEVAGAVVSLSPKFVAGGTFAAGEVLLRIDPTNYDVAVDQADALVAQRQIEFDGASRLREQGYRAEAEFASAKAALASANAELVRARRNLERTRVSLPYSGMVRAREADLGQYVNVGSRLGVTFSTEVAEVRLPLTDQDLAFVDLPATGGDGSTGPGVTLSADQQGKRQTWAARIVRTEGVVDETTRVTHAVAQIIDPYAREESASGRAPLPMGTFVSASIDGRTVDGIYRVPRGALRGNGQIVIVNDESRLEIRNADLVRADAQFAYLSGGVADGERVSLTVIENPINGLRVRTADGDTSATATADLDGGGNKQ